MRTAADFVGVRSWIGTDEPVWLYISISTAAPESTLVATFSSRVGGCPRLHLLNFDFIQPRHQHCSQVIKQTLSKAQLHIVHFFRAPGKAESVAERYPVLRMPEIFTIVALAASRNGPELYLPNDNLDRFLSGMPLAFQ